MIYSTTSRLRQWHFPLTFVLVAWLVLALASTIAEAAEPEKNSTEGAGCMPSNCIAKCNPGCSSDQICVLGTMTTCGICPISTCYHRGVIDGSSNNSKSSSGENGPLIGGIVGGLVGAGLVVSAIGYACFRYKQKRKQKNTLPITYTGNTMTQAPPLPPQHQQQQPEQNQQLQQTRQVSGVIPIAYVPPQPAASVEQQQQAYDYAVRSSLLQNRSSRNMKHSSTSSDPFSDCNRTVIDDDDDDESVIQAPAQTYQVTRAKPQIMRVNTIRQQEENNIDGRTGVKRSGSTRTILTKEDNPPSREAINENPFDDRHQASNKPTDSILSGPGDGEITIIWDGK